MSQSYCNLLVCIWCLLLGGLLLFFLIGFLNRGGIDPGKREGLGGLEGGEAVVSI